MRSLHLSNLIKVRKEANPADMSLALAPGLTDKSTRVKRMLDTKEVMQKFPIDLANWPYAFSLEFKDRTMRLRVRTQEELAQWSRIFTLIAHMNKHGVDLFSVNPLDHESRSRAKKLQQSS